MAAPDLTTDVAMLEARAAVHETLLLALLVGLYRDTEGGHKTLEQIMVTLRRALTARCAVWQRCAMSLPVRAAGIPWYRREDYARILAVMEDAHLLPDTWEDWFKQAKQVRDNLRRQGVIVEQVTLDPDGFAAWCRGRGLHINAQARMVFANEEAHRRHGKTH